MCPAVSLEVGLHVAEHVKFGRHWKAYNFLVWNLAVTMLLSTGVDVFRLKVFSKVTGFFEDFARVLGGSLLKWQHLQYTSC